MTEKLYEPLPDLDAYLERIGMNAPRKPSPDYLDELIDAHQRAVPFENLDVYEHGIAPSLGKADLFDKIVTRHRGGYCFELNGLFYSLLAGLGFEARPCIARVTLRPNPHPLISHRANIVTVDGRRFLADVGFGGPMPNFAPELENGTSRTELGKRFALYDCGDSWWDVGFTGSADEERRVLRICETPVEEHDFVPLSFFQAQNPQSVFRQNRLANIRTVDGAYDLRNSTFTEFSDGKKTATEIADETTIDQLLADKFGITNWR